MARKLKKLDLSEIEFKPKWYGGAAPEPHEARGVVGVFMFSRQRHHFRVTKFDDDTYSIAISLRDVPPDERKFKRSALCRREGALATQAHLLTIAEMFGG